jgi:hypothetical protein
MSAHCFLAFVDAAAPGRAFSKQLQHTVIFKSEENAATALASTPSYFRGE